MAAKKIAYDEDKFQELVLYVADRCQDDPNFGATKLNKILFYADFFAFGELGKPITGATYVKQTWGPVPKQFLSARGKLLRSEDAAFSRRERFGRIQKRIVALREADLSEFSGEEVAIVDAVIRLFGEQNASEVSAFSHREVGWKVARLGEEIPYSTVFLSAEPPTESDMKRAWELAVEHGFLEDVG